MRTPILTRSAIAVASLAIGSATLAAVPAMADTPSGITRQTVLGAAVDYRSFFGSSDRADAKKLVETVCAIGSDVGRDYYLTPVQQPDGVDGVLVQAYVDSDGTNPSRSCTFAAFATTQTFSTMSGTATITGQEPETSELAAAAAPSHTYALSGDVYVTAPVADIGYGDFAVATASGEVSTKAAATTTSSRVVTPKTTRQKKAARTVYERRISSAKKSYAKAKDKAGSSSRKKAAAKKVYVAKRNAAKAAYLKATAGTLTIVVTETPTFTKTAFAVTTEDRRL